MSDHARKGFVFLDLEARMAEKTKKKAETECEVCQGAGYICEVCNHADGDCTCEDGPELVPCADCPPQEEN